MRILQLIPGTGSFLCGSCLRDTTLARAMRRRGHLVDVVPLYLPLRLEAEDADARAPVMMGGVNVWLRHESALFRRIPRSLTGWLDTGTFLQPAGRKSQWTDPRDLGPLTVSTLEGIEGPLAGEVEALVEALNARERPDVILLSNAMLAGLAGPLARRIERPVVCTLQGEAPFLDSLPLPHRERAWDVLRRRADDVSRFLAVSGAYGREMSDRLGFGTDRCRVVWNGIDVDGFAPAAPPSAPPAIPTIGYLARMCAEKGLRTLIEAFCLLVDRDDAPPDLRLRVAGVRLASDESFVEDCIRRLREAGCEDRVEIRPNVSREEKIELLRSSSVLSVPATYGESFGLYVLEAWACGVPVVQPRHGAFPELIEPVDGGTLCEPDDPASLAEALFEMLTDGDRRERQGAAGRAAVLDRFTSDHMAARVEQAIHGL